jgi:fatty-acyl-CoA synthase
MLHAWGMTEMAPVGATCHLPSDLLDAPADEQIRYRVKQGTPLPMIEIRARSETGLVPWDGQAMGELEVRGPWVASAYYNVSGPDDRFTDDGWFRTGDIVTITPRGCIEIADRSKDLVKSGGEWISSVALENALMGHPKIAEAAVIAVPRDYLAPHFAKWWLPDAVHVVSQIPRTAAGKFLKSQLREQFRSAFSA